ncbi:membrane progestin receptor alpha-like [Babylonia areolata]|uniref:membrane progestin receptor alpha-like n=1 Tax=Babylonia areolata TaxID=304850 RepID=UPI003FCF8F9F
MMRSTSRTHGSKKEQRSRGLLSREKKENNNDHKPCTKHKTLIAEDVENMFQEPYTLTGYRLSNQPWSYYIASLWWVHNETVNVWTHLIGCVLLVVHAVYLGMRLDRFRDSRAGLMVVFALTCFFCNLFSSLAHLLHTKSAKHHYVLFFVDYAGIFIYLFGSCFYTLYMCSSPEQYLAVKLFFLPTAMIACYMSFVAFLLARLKFQKVEHQWKRKVLMVCVILMLMTIILPITGRYVGCFQDEGCSVKSQSLITVVFVFLVLQGVSFTAMLPERVRPGTFDIWGHSHQWFHVLVTGTQQLQLHALHVDYVERGRAAHVDTPLSSLLVTLGLLMAMQAVTIRLVTPAIERKVAEGPTTVGSESGEVLGKSDGAELIDQHGESEL